MKGHGRKKSWSERVRTASRVRTKKTGRNKPRKRSDRDFGATARTAPTTGQIDFVFDEDGKPTKIFTPVS